VTAPHSSVSRAIRAGAALATLAVGVALGACNTEGAKPPVSTAPSLADTADQTMFKVRTLLTDQGLMRAELLADTAYAFEEGTRFEMRGVHTTFYTKNGAKDAVLTSREGTYNTRLGNMEARGNVVVVSEDGRRLTTPELRYDQAKNEIASDSAFVATDPQHRLEGIGFRSDPNMNNVRCLNACRGSAGTVNVPTSSPAGAAPAARDTVGGIRPGSRPGTFRLP
jgi:LPS export ABC transporter protein LptC